MVEEECPDETSLKPVADHFSPLPAHLSPMQLLLNAVSPLLESIPDPVEEDGYFKPRPRLMEDGEHTPVELPPPLMTTPTSKSMATGATIVRFYDMAASDTSASLPLPTLSTYHNRRHEKEKKQRELSRNSCTSRVALSRIQTLQEKLVPESGDEAKRVHSSRCQLLNAILVDVPTPQPTTAPLLAAPPPPPPRPTAMPHVSVAAQEIERERERRRRVEVQRASCSRNAACPPPTATATTSSCTTNPNPGSHTTPCTISPIDAITQRRILRQGRTAQTCTP